MEMEGFYLLASLQSALHMSNEWFFSCFPDTSLAQGVASFLWSALEGKI